MTTGPAIVYCVSTHGLKSSFAVSSTASTVALTLPPLIDKSANRGKMVGLACYLGNLSPMQQFPFIMIKPSHYDDDGYVIQWAYSYVPSNSLASLYGLAMDCKDRKILGEDVDIDLTVYDETNTRVRVDKIIEVFAQAGGKGLVGFVGVQSNQFPRAGDVHVGQ
jgi:hypothetical protein